MPCIKPDQAKHHQDLQAIFHRCFFDSFNTRLQGNALEPLYTPATATEQTNTIYYRDDYFSSALHEVAHWCIAGAGRRQQEDYGYWYTPDGRNTQQQLNFEAVECKPQALEWAFSIACGIEFHVSIDNLSAQRSSDEINSLQQKNSFTKAVNRQLKDYVKKGFPPRAAIFLSHLHDFYASRPLSAFDSRLDVSILPKESHL